MDTKALRQKVLDLAIRGKLVPQDPNDEPASVLLERIRAEKAQMVKEGKLKPKDIKNDTIIYVGDDNLHYEKFQDGTVKCIEDEIPFDLPEGWEWARVASISKIVTDGEHKTPRRCDEFKGYYLLSARNIQNGFISLETVDYVDEEEFNRISKRCNPQKDDILISCSGSVGRIAIVIDDNNYVMVRSAAMIRYMEMYPLFTMYALQSEELQKQIRQSSKQTAQANLFQGAILSLLLPIPPYKEQIAIAEKLKKITTLITETENNVADINNYISLAKSAILNLAIRGELVPQDLTEIPAKQLLDEIVDEKKRLNTERKNKKNTKESIIFRGDDNSYYRKINNQIESLAEWQFDDLPDTWALCSLGDICDYGNCINVDSSNIPEEAWVLDLEDIEKDTGKILKRLNKSDRPSTSTKHVFKEGQVLYSKLRPYLNKVVLADEDGFCTSEIVPLKFAEAIIPAYAKYYLMSPAFLRYANQCSYGVKMPRLGTEDGKKAIFTIPPTEEQKRIVSKVEALFSYLDKIQDALE